MWANRLASERQLPEILNVYILDRENMFNEAHIKIFENYDKDWLNFIVACRKGDPVWEEYDYIEGALPTTVS